MHNREKTLLTLFIISLSLSLLSQIIGQLTNIELSPLAGLFLFMIFFIDIIMIVSIFVLSIKEMKRGNKALGFALLAYALIQILLYVISLLAGFYGGASISNNPDAGITGQVISTALS